MEVVQRPDRMFDQYHALLLAERFLALPAVRDWARERVAAAVPAQRKSGALGRRPRLPLTRQGAIQFRVALPVQVGWHDERGGRQPPLRVVTVALRATAGSAGPRRYRPWCPCWR